MTAVDTPRPAEVRRLPAAFLALDAEQPAQMSAGAPGKVSTLRLCFERRDGRTRLVHNYGTGSQRVQRVHHLDHDLPDLAVVFLQSVGGGILQGDRLALEIVVGPGARALVTTQSATKLYRMERNYATQRLDVRVEAGGHLELLTDAVIPFRGARLYSEVELCVDDDATLVYRDGLAPGRVASGEALAFRLVHTRLRGRAGDGRLRLADTAVLAPGRADPAGPGLLGGVRELGTHYVLCPAEAAARLAERMHAALAPVDDVEASASTLPHGDGAVARVLGSSARTVGRALHEVWRVTRAELLSAGVPAVHRVKHGWEPAGEDERST